MSKDELHRLVEALPEKETSAVKRFLEFVLAKVETEDRAWLGQLPPCDWGPEGPSKGKPVRYKSGVGLIVEGGKQ